MSLPYYSESKKAWIEPEDLNQWNLAGAIRKLRKAVATPHPGIPEVELTRVRLTLQGLEDEARRRGMTV